MIGSATASIDITAKDRTGRAFASARRNLNSFSKASRGLASGLGVGLSAGALIGFSKSVIEYGSSITDAAVATNTGVEALQALRYAAREAGASEQSLTNALVRVQKAGIDASNGLTTYSRAFDALGINVSEYIALPTERKLEVIANAMSSASSQQAAYSAAMDLLGTRNAPRLMEVLQRLSVDGFDAIAESARNAGQIMSTETAQAMDSVADSMELFKTSWSNKWAKFLVQARSGLAVLGFSDLSNEVAATALEIDHLRAQIAGMEAAGNTHWKSYSGYLEKVVALEAKLIDLRAASESPALDGYSPAFKEGQREFDELLKVKQSGDAAHAVYDRLTRQLEDMGRTPAQKIKVLRGEIEKLKTDAAELLKLGAQDPAAYYSKLSEAARKEIELRRLDTPVAGKIESPALLRQPVISSYGFPREGVARRRDRGWMPGHVDLTPKDPVAGAVGAITSSAAGSAASLDAIAQAFIDLSEKIELVEQNLKNAR